MKVVIKELKTEEINNEFLNDFNRYQEVNESYIKKNEKWIIEKKMEKTIINWDNEYKKRRVKNIIKFINEKGFAIGGFENKQLIGFACLLNEKFGTKKQYIELKYLYISYEYRNKGIGKKLLDLCIEKAKEFGANKVYISAGTSIETQKFYIKYGFKDAMELKEEYNEDDRQMEYEI